MASILQKIVTLLGDPGNFQRYTLSGSDVYRDGQKIASYSVRTESNREILEVSTISGGRMTSSESILNETTNQRRLLHD